MDRSSSSAVRPRTAPTHGPWGGASRAAVLSEPTETKGVFIENSTEFSDVQVLFDTGMSLVCLVDGIRVRVPSHLIEVGSEVRVNGDRGRLVIPTSLALSIGLV